jgi:hypothetical protein
MILTIGPGGCGFTFLNWTISFLRGDCNYQTLDGVAHEIEYNPLIGDTAHGYRKDHICDMHSTDVLKSATDNSIIYMVPNSQDNFEYMLSLSGKKIVFDPLQHGKMLLARSIMCIPKQNHTSVKFIDYLYTRHDPDLVRQVVLECYKFFVQYYTVPQNSNSICIVDYNDIFNRLPSVLTTMFEYLEIPIDNSRLDSWNQVYNQYQQQNQKDFCAEFLSAANKNNGDKKEIFMEILKWRNGLCLST